MNPKSILLFTLGLLLVSCSEENEILVPDPLYPGQATFRSTVYVEIKKEDGKPIPNVVVRLGSFTGTTDETGFICLDRVVTSRSNYLQVEKEGYFNASRRFYAEAGKTATVYIIMTPDQPDAVFSSSSAKTITIDESFALQLPADAYAYKSGVPYEGTVQVSVHGIPGDDPLLSYKMPGELLGIGKDGATGALASLGMIEVELYSDAGETLQLKPGYEAEVQIKIPGSILPNAPGTIPMWYFDEEEGIWKEEGEAIRNGDTYIAKVKHFSFWNCDAWFPTLSWHGEFRHENGTPASHVEVCITIDNLNTTSCAFTSEGGWIHGSLALGESMHVRVFDRCYAVVFNAPLGPLTESDTSSQFIIPATGGMVTQILGTALACNASPVTRGYARIVLGQYAYHISIDSMTGTYASSIYNCEEDEISIKIVNLADDQYSDTYLYPNAETILVDTITTCHDDASIAVLQIEGFPDPFIFKPLECEFREGRTYVYYPDSTGNYFYLQFPGMSTGSHSQVDVTIVLQIGIEAYAQTEIADIEITSYGPSGGYVQGSLSGIFYSGQNGGPPYYPFTGTFSALRN